MSFNAPSVVWATGTCGKCGAAIGLKARPPDGNKDYVDVRCGTCGGLTTADEFEHLAGGGGA